MAWKPYRGNGIGFETALRKSEHHRNQVSIMVSEQSYLEFKNINRFSKHIYLHYLNDKKRGSGNLDYSLINDYFKNLLLKNLSYVYKPMQKLLKNTYNIN